MNTDLTSPGPPLATTATADGRRATPTDGTYHSTLDATGALRVHGTVDELSARAFLEDVLGLVRAGGGSGVVDLSDADFFSCAAAGALVAGWTRARGEGCRLEVVVGAGTVAQRVLTVCGLPHRLA